MSKLAESIEGKVMNKGTLFILSKIWRLPFQGSTSIYKKFPIFLWANEHFTINLFSYVENMQTYLTDFSNQSQSKSPFSYKCYMSLFTFLISKV